MSIAERVGDPALLLRLVQPPRDHRAARGRARKARGAVQSLARQLATDIGDTVRRVGRLEQPRHPRADREQLGRSAHACCARPWTRRARRASPSSGDARRSNLGVLAARVGEYEAAAEYLGEALQLCATVQNSELQLYATYNLAHLERDRGADPGGRGDVRAGDGAGAAHRSGGGGVRSASRVRAVRAGDGAVESARRAAELVGPFLESADGLVPGAGAGRGAGAPAGPAGWADRRRRSSVWREALALADPSDVYGAAWLTAEFGEEMRPHAPELVTEALQRYASRPEVLANPRIRDAVHCLIN